jgi:hypothetical protein
VNDVRYSDLLPPKHIVSVGGGITSTLLLPLEVIKRYGAENVQLVMAMVADDETNARPLVEAVVNLTKLPIRRITPISPTGGAVIDVPPGQWALWSIWDVFNATGRMGSTLADPCSRVLKRETLKTWMLNNALKGYHVLHVGITSDEIDRMLAIRANWGGSGYQVEAPLADDETLTRETAIERCKALLGFVPELYQRGNSHNNCAGFCVKAGHAEMARLLHYDRARYLQHEAAELAHQQQHEHTATIMRDRRTVAGAVESTPLTLRDFRLRMEARWSGRLPGFDPFDGLDSMPGCKYCEAA